MKKLFLIVLVAFSTLLACAQKEERGSSVKLSDAEAYALKKPTTRASGEGRSPRPNLARQYAVDDARGALSQALEMAILNASKTLSSDIYDYLGGNEDSDAKVEMNERKYSLAKSISQNILKGTPIVKMDKFYKKSNRMYTIVVCVEYMGDTSQLAKETVENLKLRLSDKDRARIEADYDKWQKEIENELENQSSEILDENE